MNLKPQPRPRRAPRVTRRRPAARSRGHGARRPGTPLRRRFARRLPSIGRVVAALGAAVVVAAMLGALNGPWLRITDVAWAGEQHTSAADIEAVLAAQRGASALAVDTGEVSDRLEALPAVAEASVTVSLTGRVEASIVEHEAAFVWETRSMRFLGAIDGTLFAVLGAGEESPALAHVRDERSGARLIAVGDQVPDGVLRTALALFAIDPAALGSKATHLSVSIDDEFGFRLASSDPAWEAAFGVYGLDPSESAAQAAARLERQVTAVRTLFATERESDILWLDVRNPGKVYFRANG